MPGKASFIGWIRGRRAEGRKLATAGQGRGWNANRHDDTTIVTLQGDWIALRQGCERGAPKRIIDMGAHILRFDTVKLGVWDSALIAFLAKLRDASQASGVTFDKSGLPSAANRLLALATWPAAKPVRRQHMTILTYVSELAIAIGSELSEATILIGETWLRSLVIFRGKVAIRGSDFLAYLSDGGVSALPIVTVVNVLVGAILAFVGAVQLRRFGADLFLANLVGIALVREMVALMTAIIMAGRTGGAYAANIATMQSNEEIDALRVVGIPVLDYLILPRILALTAVMPLLYLYGCFFGTMGGLLVAISILDLSPVSFINELRMSVPLSQFAFGLAKSLSFGILIAIVGCRVGLRAGRSATEVGKAATTAVVFSIVGIIALDAIFAVCANVLGI